MNTRNIFLGAVIIALFAGALMAIGGAAANNVAGSGQAPTRWAGASAGSNNTQGGNITLMNLTVTSLTNKWAAYYGNISGSIILSASTGASNIFAWAYSVSSGGEVCMSTGSANTFLSPTNGSVATLDTVFSLSGADSSANTQNQSNCSLVLSTGTVQQVTEWRHMGNSTFHTCAITTGGATAKNNFAFCTNISSTGKWFGSDTGIANYELMIPTVPGAVETYYFYAELS